MEQNRQIGCLIMAAGNATRFQANKLAAELGGRSLIRRAMEAVPKDLFSRIVVVTQYPPVAKLAEEFSFEAIHNDKPELGISRTIFLGTKAMAECDAILYLVSDQPMLSPSSIRLVVQHWLAHPQGICAAAFQGRRGNPCIFPREFFPEMEALTGDHGGSSVIRRHPERLRTVDIPELELTDVDTPKALVDLAERLEDEA